MNNQNRFAIYENDDQFDFDQNDKTMDIRDRPKPRTTDDYLN